MSKKQQLSIGILEDNPMISHGLQCYLKEHPEFEFDILFSTESPKTFIENFKEKTPLILIMDIIMENVTGLEMFEKIFQLRPNQIVICFSNVKSKNIIKELFSLGISAYVSKTENPEILNQAIESILFKNKAYVSEEFKYIVKSKKLPVRLTQKESKILAHVLNEKSIKEIAEIENISANTVDYHRKNLFKKFEVNNLVGLIKAAISQGFAGGMHY